MFNAFLPVFEGSIRIGALCGQFSGEASQISGGSMGKMRGQWTTTGKRFFGEQIVSRWLASLPRVPSEPRSHIPHRQPKTPDA